MAVTTRPSYTCVNLKDLGGKGEKRAEAGGETHNGLLRLVLLGYAKAHRGNEVAGAHSRGTVQHHPVTPVSLIFSIAFLDPHVVMTLTSVGQSCRSAEDNRTPRRGRWCR